MTCCRTRFAHGFEQLWLVHPRSPHTASRPTERETVRPYRTSYFHAHATAKIFTCATTVWSLQYCMRMPATRPTFSTRVQWVPGWLDAVQYISSQYCTHGSWSWTRATPLWPCTPIACGTHRRSGYVTLVIAEHAGHVTTSTMVLRTLGPRLELPRPRARPPRVPEHRNGSR